MLGGAMNGLVDPLGSTPVMPLRSNSGSANSNKNTTVKAEKRARAPSVEDNGEYDEWAKRLVNRPIPQLVTGTPQVMSNSSVNNFLLQSATNGNGHGANGSTSVTVGSDGLPPHKGFDFDSAIGRFTWHTMDEDKYVPCLFRSGEKYCCVRMVEVSILGDFLTLLPQDIYDAAKLDCHNVTSSEAKLLSYINNWHCDGFYGGDTFTLQDVVVSLTELEKFYAYLVFAYRVLQSGGKNQDESFSRCGFVRVNQDSLIPYTVLNEEEKAVPLFYFEGQIDILKAKSTPLSGWPLAYLKICCKVQGVRKDLMSGDSLQIIKLTDLKSYFPKRTVFTEKCWPPTKGKSLLPKQSTANLGYYGGAHMSNQNAVPSSRWTRNVPNDQVFNQSKSNCNSLSTRTIMNVNTNNNGPTQHQIPSGSGSLTTGMSFSNLSNQLPRQFNFNSQTPINLVTSSAANQFFQQRGLPLGGMNMSTSLASTTSTVTVNPSPIPTHSVVGSTNGQQIQNPRNQVMAKNISLSKIKAVGPPVELSRLSPIPEHPDGNREGAYTVRMIIIDKEFMHCINHKPFKADGFLIVLQEFLMRFFPNVSLYPTAVSVLKHLDITTYLPNTAQVKRFNSFGFTIQRVWEIPLISASEAAEKIQRIRMLLTPKPNAPRPRQPETHHGQQLSSNVNSISTGPRMARVAPNGYNNPSTFYTGR